MLGSNSPLSPSLYIYLFLSLPLSSLFLSFFLVFSLFFFSISHSLSPSLPLIRGWWPVVGLCRPRYPSREWTYSRRSMSTPSVKETSAVCNSLREAWWSCILHIISYRVSLVGKKGFIFLFYFEILTTNTLKGQVTFLKLCLLVVCLALITPRFTLFWLTTVFRPKNAFICLCQRSLFMPACAVLWHIHRIGEWETCQKTLIWIQFFFWYYNQKTITSIAVPKKRLRWHRHINAFFGLKTVVNQKA